MDITPTTTPKSDQQNYDDYANGVTRIVTISKVSAGSAEQPVDIHLEEFPGRAFRPSKSMRRVLVAAWGAETSVYVGRKMQLFGDPSIKFAGVAVGGVRISHLSHIDKELKIALTVTRGKKEPFVVQLLHETSAKVKSTESALASEGQIEHIGTLLNQLDITVRDEAVAKINSLIEPRSVASRAELTKDEATVVINVLSAEVESR